MLLRGKGCVKDLKFDQDIEMVGKRNKKAKKSQLREEKGD